MVSRANLIRFVKVKDGHWVLSIVLLETVSLHWVGERHQVEYPLNREIIDAMVTAWVSLRVGLSGAYLSDQIAKDMVILHPVGPLLTTLKTRGWVSMKAQFMESLARALPNATHFVSSNDMCDEGLYVPWGFFGLFKRWKEWTIEDCLVSEIPEIARLIRSNRLLLRITAIYGEFKSPKIVDALVANDTELMEHEEFLIPFVLARPQHASVV